MRLAPEELKEALDRLRRIEGQVRGIQGMVEERDCAEVIVQIAAARSALNRVALLLLQGYTRECLAGVRRGEREEEEIEELLRSYLTLS
ncbi:MAG: metal-sensitive transcriptional regulator [Candidatus Bipolaricaulia bacterium]